MPLLSMKRNSIVLTKIVKYGIDHANAWQKRNLSQNSVGTWHVLHARMCALIYFFLCFFCDILFLLYTFLCVRVESYLFEV